jgi:hypothetical protein
MDSGHGGVVSAHGLTAVGAEVRRGTPKDLDGLRAGAAAMEDV